MNTTDYQMIKNFFTDDEWSAIESAMKDYADYGDEEAELADSIDAKIYSIFKGGN
jgi:hypothetical protein